MKTVAWGEIAALVTILAAVVAVLRFIVRAEVDKLKDWMDGRFVRRSECAIQTKEYDGRLERIEAARAAVPRR